MSSGSWVRNRNDELAVARGCYFDLAAAERVRDFFGRFLVHSKGRFAGKPFELLDWQWRDIIAPAFGWKQADGTRRFRRVGVGVPKKNGKSTLLAGIGLYLLTKDHEPGAEVYTAAGDREQASIIFDESANMVRASKHMSAVLKIRDSRKAILYRKQKAKYRALSSDANTKEGFNTHGLLFDELHTQPNRDLWNALYYSGAGRLQPMYWWISTAGELDETSLWMEQWKYCRGVQAGTIEDIHTLGTIYEPNPGDDWTQEATWAKANPSLGVTVRVEEMREACEKAKLNPAEASSFKRYRLNIATAAESEWISPEFWAKCGRQYSLSQLRRLRGAKCYAALDLASTTDLIALVLVFVHKDRVLLWPYFWVPQRAVIAREKSNQQRYDAWVEAGHLKVTTKEPVADYSVIRRDVLKILRAVRCDKLVVDRWNATQLAYSLRKALKRADVDTVLQFANCNFRTLSAATKEFERLVISERLRHPDNPVLNWMFGNVVIQQDAMGNRRPDKGKSKDKIDGIAAAVLGLAVLMEEQKDRSSLEREGLSDVGSE